MSKLARKSGQGMTEYIIIIAIIAIGAILVVGLFGKQIKGVFSGISGSLAGDVNSQNDEGSDQAANNVKRSGMDDYDKNPQGEAIP
jgi:Flp pilus assembly pilin Flp